jgi:hypothetical protein
MKLSLIALLLCIAVFAACGGDDDEGGDSAPSQDAQAILGDAAARFAALNSFHFELDHSEGGTPIVQDLVMKTASGEIEVPDRLQADLEVDSPLGDVDVSVISIGEELWLDIFGDYQQLPGVTVLEIFDPANGIPNVAEHIEDPTVEGSQELNGEECDIVEGTVASEYLEGIAPVADAGNDVNVRVWVGRETHLIHRVIVTGQVASDDPEDMVRTIELSRFDEEFGIEPP